METITQKQFTVKDYKNMEEGPPYFQLINEALIMSPAPKTTHQDILGEIFNQIKNFIIKRAVGKVFIAPTDVYFDEHNVLQPDIVYISNERKNIIKDDGIHGAPDLIIEILSPSTAYYDTKIKKRIYQDSGVKEFWIVDPEDNEVRGFENIDGKFQEFYKGYGKFTLKQLTLEIFQSF